MTKTETLRQSAATSNATRVEQLSAQLETLRQIQQQSAYQSAQDLATTLEPLAQALAALTDETRQTLIEIDRRSREQGETFSHQISAATRNWREAAQTAQTSAERLNQAGSRLEWNHYALAVIIAVLTAALVSAFWLWLAQPTVQTTLDPKAVAEYLKPAVIEAFKHSKGK